MTTLKIGKASGSISIGSLLIGVLLVVIGFFLYGVNGFIATFAIIILLFLLSYVGLVPFAGAFIYFYWVAPQIVSFVLEKTGLEHDLFFYIIFVYFGIVAVIYTVITSIFVGILILGIIAAILTD